jgi:hypothetical protein
MRLRPIDPAGAAIVILVIALTGCLEHHDSIVRGTADSVDILYDGDLAGTLPLARKHCAQFERVPQLRQSREDNVINYQCVVP